MVSSDPFSINVYVWFFSHKLNNKVYSSYWLTQIPCSGKLLSPHSVQLHDFHMWASKRIPTADLDRTAEATVATGSKETYLSVNKISQDFTFLLICHSPLRDALIDVNGHDLCPLEPLLPPVGTGTPGQSWACSPCLICAVWVPTFSSAIAKPVHYWKHWPRLWLIHCLCWTCPSTMDLPWDPWAVFDHGTHWSWY